MSVLTQHTRRVSHLLTRVLTRYLLPGAWRVPHKLVTRNFTEAPSTNDSYVINSPYDDIIIPRVENLSSYLIDDFGKRGKLEALVSKHIYIYIYIYI